MALRTSISYNNISHIFVSKIIRPLLVGLMAGCKSIKLADEDPVIHIYIYIYIYIYVTRSEKSRLPRTQQQDTLFTIKQ